MTQNGGDGTRELTAGRSAVSLAEYQEGSIVSRILIKKKAGTVTVFAFDKGQGLSEHKTPFDALVHVLDGKAEFLVGGDAHVIGADEMILLPANVPHEVKALERFKMLLTMMRSE